MREFVDSGIKLVSGFQSMVLRKFNFGIETGDFLSAFFFVISSVYFCYRRARQCNKIDSNGFALVTQASCGSFYLSIYLR